MTVELVNWLVTWFSSAHNRLLRFNRSVLFQCRVDWLLVLPAWVAQPLFHVCIRSQANVAEYESASNWANIGTAKKVGEGEAAAAKGETSTEDAKE